MKRFTLDPSLSQFTVQAFASGVLSFLGHSPTFAVRDFAGTIEYDGATLTSLRLNVTVKAGGLELLDRVGPADRADIEGRMQREVLEGTSYPAIHFRGAAVSADKIAPGQYRLRIAGELSLHGVVHPHQMDTELLVFADGLRLRGEFPLRLSDYRIKPVNALGGAIQLKDELRLSFDVGALPEGA